jgi:hypothetical protein
MDHSPAPDPFAISSLEALARHYEAPRELVLKKVAPRLDDTARAFIAASPFCILSTIGSHGPHATPRGDAPGFVACLEDGSLALPDRRGNNRLDALRDIIEDPRVALLFLIPGVGEALRVGGTARITADPALCAGFVERGKTPASVILVTPNAVYMQMREIHCALTPLGRYAAPGRRADSGADDRISHRRHGGPGRA